MMLSKVSLNDIIQFALIFPDIIALIADDVEIVVVKIKYINFRVFYLCYYENHLRQACHTLPLA